MSDKLRVAAKAALELLDNDDRDCAFAANILRAALAETQMPTKICGPNLVGILNAAGFYRKKEWVGLTDGEILEMFGVVGTSGSDINPRGLLKDTRRIEAKLKEKNT
jgi:hypothetical protein